MIGLNRSWRNGCCRRARGESFNSLEVPWQYRRLGDLGASPNGSLDLPRVEVSIESTRDGIYKSGIVVGMAP